MRAAVNGDKRAAWHDKVWEPENRRTIRFFRCCHWSHADTIQNGNTEHVQDPYSVEGRKEQERKKSWRPRAMLFRPGLAWKPRLWLDLRFLNTQAGPKPPTMAWRLAPAFTRATWVALFQKFLTFQSTGLSWLSIFFTLFAKGEPELQKLSGVGKFFNRWRLEPLDPPYPPPNKVCFGPKRYVLDQESEAADETAAHSNNPNSHI